MRKPLLAGTFEQAEFAFVERFLQHGMTVLDVGAHHGLYTLLASKRVGPSGRVIAFEPSPRERKALRLHLTLNRCRNVIIQEEAIGEENGDSLLHIVEGWASGCNSLEPPSAIIGASASLLHVRVAKLDDWLAANHLEHVDFIKLDIEGAELSALKGATRLLEGPPRPIILAELQDVRTAPWGYRAKEAVAFVKRHGFRWFTPMPNGTLATMQEDVEHYEGNFVAVPEERFGELKEMIEDGSRS
jgi:FkbM family methyltransferase